MSIIAVPLTTRTSRVLSLTATGLLRSAEEVSAAAAKFDNATALELEGVSSLLQDLASALVEAGKVALERERKAGTAGLN